MDRLCLGLIMKRLLIFSWLLISFHCFAAFPGIFKGAGSPEGVQVGRIGDFWINTSGGASDTLYTKKSGTATTTGWVAIGGGGGGNWQDNGTNATLSGIASVDSIAVTNLADINTFHIAQDGGVYNNGKGFYIEYFLTNSANSGQAIYLGDASYALTSEYDFNAGGAGNAGLGQGAGIIGVGDGDVTTLFGVIGYSPKSISSITNIGIAGNSITFGNTGPVIGGYFQISSGNSFIPAFTSSAILADNTDTSSPLFVGRNNGSQKIRMDPGGLDDGSNITYIFDTASRANTGAPLMAVRNNGTNEFNVSVGGAITTASSGTSAGAWKLGPKVTGVSVALNLTNYVEVNINGTVVKLGIVQ